LTSRFFNEICLRQVISLKQPAPVIIVKTTRRSGRFYASGFYEQLKSGTARRSMTNANRYAAILIKHF